MSQYAFKRDGYNLSNDELRRVQMIELEMLVEIDRICKIHNIEYCISAGTQLGAIRHGGFIPWDDDIDVAFIRSEYERFREACKESLDDKRFYFQDQISTSGYRWGYGKLRRKNTLFTRLNQECMPYEQGVFVDLMPYDYVPDLWIYRKIHAITCYLYRKSFWARVGKHTGKGLSKFAFILLDLIPDDLLFSSFQKFIGKSNRSKTKRMRILTLPVPGNQNGYSSEWLTNTVSVYFEGVEVRGMKHYDEYLSYKYGDYMKMPPIDKRKVHPVSAVSLNAVE